MNTIRSQRHTKSDFNTLLQSLIPNKEAEASQYKVIQHFSCSGASVLLCETSSVGSGCLLLPSGWHTGPTRRLLMLTLWQREFPHPWISARTVSCHKVSGFHSSSRGLDRTRGRAVIAAIAFVGFLCGGTDVVKELLIPTICHNTGRNHMKGNYTILCERNK